MTTTSIDTEQSFVDNLEKAFKDSNIEFARSYYLFATARLSDTYNSGEIYQRYPQLLKEDTFHQIKKLFDNNTDNEQIKRLFTSVLGFYTGNKLLSLIHI